ncbi:hypothetical protein [Paraburkholderia dilworthii]|uniref:hypothetical protein n=1 Tax=Paraburkholderia dilworthii TaxID=948106 RepID=UPI00041091E2|nr:hypothetical protein [Paraburkholderia dilworthii]
MPRTSATPFALAERAIISLYDGGVLSPAVLERLLAAFAQEKTDWETEPTERSVDGRSLHEVVVLTMLPGESLRSGRKSFMSVIAHITGASKANKTTRGSGKVENEKNQEDEDDEEDDERKDEQSAAEDDTSAELAEQLSGSTRTNRRGRTSRVKDSDSPARQPSRTAAFNPLLNAAAPRKSKS